MPNAMVRISGRNHTIQQTGIGRSEDYSRLPIYVFVGTAISGSRHAGFGYSTIGSITNFILAGYGRGQGCLANYSSSLSARLIELGISNTGSFVINPSNPNHVFVRRALDQGIQLPTEIAAYRPTSRWEL